MRLWRRTVSDRGVLADHDQPRRASRGGPLRGHDLMRAKTSLLIRLLGCIEITELAQQRSNRFVAARMRAPH